MGDLLLSDDETQKPKSNIALTSTATPTNVTSRTTDNKDSIKDKSSLMDSLFGNNKNPSSKSDEKVMTQNPSNPLGGGTNERKMNETERYVTTVT